MILSTKKKKTKDLKKRIVDFLLFGEQTHMLISK